MLRAADAQLACVYSQVLLGLLCMMLYGADVGLGYGVGGE